MKSILVLEPGLMTTVQDLGRPGYGLLGISPSGAADPLSLRLGNRLLNNPPHAAALEMTLLGGSFQFTEDTYFSLAGAPMGATLDDEKLSLGRSYRARPKQILKFQWAPTQTRTYLCCQGGLDVPLFLESRSTHITSGLGGWKGRALKAGDEIPLGPSSPLKGSIRLRPGFLEKFSPRKILRVLAGPDKSLFSESTWQRFLTNSFRVSEYSNRLGIRLEGSIAQDQVPAEGLSQGVPLGTVQISPDGQPTVLFVEQQTVGGYPQLACVISADHFSLGQLRPGDSVQFEEVTLDKALDYLRAQENFLTAEDLILHDD